VRRVVLCSIFALAFACRTGATPVAADAGASAARDDGDAAQTAAIDASVAPPATTASAAPEEPHAPRQPLKRLAEIEPDPVTYPPPTDDEWNEAIHVWLEASEGSRCSAGTLHGWLRIWCPVERPGVGLSVIGGTREGLYLDTGKDWSTITAPLRRGDRRVVQITESRPWTWWDSTVGRGGQYGPPQVVAHYIASIAWIDTKGPTASVRRAHEASYF
jgi:hypothetical protein